MKMLKDEDKDNVNFQNEIKNPYYANEKDFSFTISDNTYDNKFTHYLQKCYSNLFCKINLGILLCCFSSCVLYIIFLGIGVITNFISNLDIFIDADNADLKWYTIILIYPLEGLAITVVMVLFALIIIALILLIMVYCYYIKLKINDYSIDHLKKIKQWFIEIKQNNTTYNSNNSIYEEL